ncbi:MAG: hypothetical protein RTV31_12270 [Candidatus Thorarchaeota archaeon]
MIRQIAPLGALLLIFSGIILGTIASALPNTDPELKEEIDTTWYLSEPFTLTDNVSFSVVVQSVEFEFLYYYAEEGVLDVPIAIFIVVHFPDAITEYLVSSVGGFIGWEYRLVVTEHTAPQAALVSGYGDGDEWYGWYYAVSPNATTTTDEPASYSAIYFTIAGVAWIIVIVFIVFDYRRRVVSG